MLQQYFGLKSQRPEALLAMRVGDFYEFYGEDAVIASRELEITLTGRVDGGERIPMAGVPFHSVEKYLARLVQKGLKVALCDQLEDPKAAKGLVRRGVTRVLTPGALVEDSMLRPGEANFLAAICVREGRVGLATLDPSTGEFVVTEVSGEEREARLYEELARLRPREILVSESAKPYGLAVREALGAAISDADEPGPDRAARRLREQFSVSNLQAFGVEDKPSAQIAASMILGYAEKSGLALSHVDRLVAYSVDGFMRLDLSTRRALELTANLGDGGRRYTLLEVLDETRTPMGQRLLRRWIDQPLLNAEAIEARLASVEKLKSHGAARGALRDALKKLSDLERLASRIAAGQAGPRDLASLRASLQALPETAEPLRLVGTGRIQELREQMSPHSDTLQTLSKALAPEPPHAARDGGVIREGYDPELDKLRALSRDGKGYIAGLEKEERERTGLGMLKVGYNSVFGYFLEVPKSQISKVPADYIRKQTTAGAERYITAALKEHEAIVMGSEERAIGLELDLFARLKEEVGRSCTAILRTARALAEIDALASLAEVAAMRGYVRPEISEADEIEIEGGRHPVVEASSSRFVPNGCRFDETRRVMVLTGPNMSGKSTYLRQVALIQLMAQIGSFVPAKSCRLGLADRVFARIGAKDELALGQSTFMVEMVESANILNHAGPRSLVILDEVGRGTSTYDGLAIAWAMVERLAEIRAKTMFSTHYHQLNALASQLQGVANFRVAVEESGDRIVWTHRVLPGGADKSYGIHVARMAGVPHEVLRRASEVLSQLEEQPAAAVGETQAPRLQLTLFEAAPSPVEEALSAVDVNAITGLEALRLIDEWKRGLGAR